MAEPKHLVGVEKAARVAGVSRWTISRKIKAGAISCTRDQRGHPRIDLAELSRVFDLDPATITARLVQPQRGTASNAPRPHVAHGATTGQAEESRAAQAAFERLEADSRRDRERIERLEAELREARADAREWMTAYRVLAERALLTDQRPDRPAPEPVRQSTAADVASESRSARDKRTPEQAAGVVESVARGILGDDLPNLLFGRRRR